jgi:hypothetical protein
MKRLLTRIGLITLLAASALSHAGADTLALQCPSRDRQLPDANAHGSAP